jgi:hypothetical protein
MNNLIIILITLVSFNSLAKKESWYIFWAPLGGSNATYTKELEEKRNTFKDSNTDEDISSSGAGELALYWPIMKSSLIGLSYSYGGTTYITEDESELFSAYGTYGLSMQFYTGSEPGYGLFFRMDYGSNVHVYKETWETDPTKDVEEKSSGSSYLVGLGAGFPLGKKKETRILIGANYSKAGKGIYEVEFVNMYFGFMF